MLTQSEADFLRHISMWGSEGYPIQKAGRKWMWASFWGVKGSPVLYRTKREATVAIETYLNILLDKHAGRI